MAQWDGLRDLNDWADYYAGRRTDPPAVTLDANSTRTAREMAMALIASDERRDEQYTRFVLARAKVS